MIQLSVRHYLSGLVENPPRRLAGVDKNCPRCWLRLFVLFRVNTPKVIHEVFETEVVVVNLETGVYYSVRGSGIDIWRAIDGGHRVEQIETAFAAPEAKALITAFVSQLEREQLITGIESSGQPPAEKMISMKQPFAEPILEKFTDMREMLLVDPIHELDEGGWPKGNPPPEQA